MTIDSSLARSLLRAALTLLCLGDLATLGAASLPNKIPVGVPYTYKTVGTLELKLYVLSPEQKTQAKPLPAIVFFHGGGWVGGPLNQFDQHCAHFASRGMVCVQAEYRYVPVKTTVPPVVCIEDARSAMRWVRSHAVLLGIDPNRIAAGGASSGGHLAAHTGLVEGTDDPADDLTVSVTPEAMILFNPVLDNSPGQYGAERVGDRVAALSPAQNVTPKAPPTILFLGTSDHLIPTATLQSFQKRMIAAGVRCELNLYEGQDHGFFNPTIADGKYYRLTVAAADQFLVSLGWIRPLAESSAGNGT